MKTKIISLMILGIIRILPATAADIVLENQQIKAAFNEKNGALEKKEDLQEAIASVQELGVKMILFSKYTWADRTTDWYREQL